MICLKLGLYLSADLADLAAVEALAEVGAVSAVAAEDLAVAAPVGDGKR